MWHNLNKITTFQFAKFKVLEFLLLDPNKSTRIVYTAFQSSCCHSLPLQLLTMTYSFISSFIRIFLYKSLIRVRQICKREVDPALGSLLFSDVRRARIAVEADVKRAWFSGHKGPSAQIYMRGVWTIIRDVSARVRVWVALTSRPRTAVKIRTFYKQCRPRLSSLLSNLLWLLLCFGVLNSRISFK